MSFSGKATYDAGAEPGYQIKEDLADNVAVIAAVKTPLLDTLGDALRPAKSTHMEWLDDENEVPRTLSTASATSAATAISVTSGEEAMFRAGDVLIVQEITTTASASSYTGERVLVTGTASDTLQVTRGYGGSTAATIPDASEVACVGHAALEGADARDDYQRARDRRENWTQIFDKTIYTSGTEDAVDVGGVAPQSEFDYQKSKKLAQALAVLEAAVINGDVPASTPQGSASVRRTMRGLIDFISTTVDGSSATSGLTKALLELCIRTIWDNGGEPDLIVMNGYQQSKAAQFIDKTSQQMAVDQYVERIRQFVTDFGIQQLVLSRYVPRDHVMVLDSKKIEVVPLQTRSFFYQDIARTGDSHKGQILGEYTMMIRNPDKAHGLITGLGFTL